MPPSTMAASKMIAYSYLNHKLEDLITALQNARLLLNNAANKISDSMLCLPLQLLVDENLHCEKDLQTLVHLQNEDTALREADFSKHYFPLNRYLKYSTVALYCEHVYVEKYMQLINDCHISAHIKTKLKHHVEVLKSALCKTDALMGIVNDDKL